MSQSQSKVGTLKTDVSVNIPAVFVREQKHPFLQSLDQKNAREIQLSEFSAGEYLVRSKATVWGYLPLVPEMNNTFEHHCCNFMEAFTKEGVGGGNLPYLYLYFISTLPKSWGLNSWAFVKLPLWVSHASFAINKVKKLFYITQPSINIGSWCDTNSSVISVTFTLLCLRNAQCSFWLHYLSAHCWNRRWGVMYSSSFYHSRAR